MNGELAIEAKGLTRRYDDLLAVDHVDLDVRRGEIFGFLGPNGAGKTTTVRMLTGVIEPSEGTALVNGCDVVREPVAARENIGVVPEQANVYLDLTVWQNLMLMGELYGVARAVRKRRASELLELFKIADRAKQKGRAMSKGLRQRLMICMALVSDPPILILDEPTSGLDVASSRLIRQLIMRMNSERGMTIFITTHNIDEADQLCHRVAIINKARIAAIDTPANLRKQFQQVQSVEVQFAGGKVDEAELAGLDGVSDVKKLSGGFRLFTTRPGQLAGDVIRMADRKSLAVENIRTCGPTLEDVFVRVTEGPEGTKQ